MISKDNQLPTVNRKRWGKCTILLLILMWLDFVPFNFENLKIKFLNYSRFEINTHHSFN